jgi:hypothetical protein
MVPNLTPTGPGATNVVPVLLIGCNNCGYMLHVNALAAGLIQGPDWAEELARYASLTPQEQTVEAGR